MPRNSKDTKALIKEIKSYIKTINTEIGSNLSYRKVSKDISRISAMDVFEKEISLNQYELRLRKYLTDLVLSTRSTFWASFRTLEKNRNHPLTKYSMTLATRASYHLTRQLCELNEEGYIKAHPRTAESAAELRDWSLAEVKKQSYYAVSPKTIPKWDTACYKAEIPLLGDNLVDSKTGQVNYTFRNDYNSEKFSKEIAVAHIYYKLGIVQAELDKLGYLSRLFSFRKVAAMNEYIAKAKQILTGVGFDEAQHAAQAIEALKNHVVSPHEVEGDNIEGEYNTQISAINASNEANVPESRLARDLLEKRKSLDSSPDTTIHKKVDSILNKHGIKEKYGEILAFANFDYAAEQYDLEKSIDSIKETAGACFSRVFKFMIRAAVEQQREINAAECLRDARDLTVIMMDHYMPASEIPELNSFDKPLYMYVLDKNYLVSVVNEYSTGTIFKNPKTRESTTVMPLPGTIDKAKEETARILGEWEADTEKLMKEDANTVSIASGNGSIRMSVHFEDDVNIIASSEELSPSVSAVKEKEEKSIGIV